MNTALEHPLVAKYLRDLDAALTSIPPAAASELSEQLRAHLLEALPPDAADDAVTAVLAALGPPSLVAAAAAPAGQSPPRGPLLRGVARRASRLPRNVWLSFAAIAIAIGLPAGTLIYLQSQPSLTDYGSFSWWSPADYTHQVDTSAGGASQNTVPIRPGHIQGFAVTIYNPSDVSQRIVGSADPISIGGGPLHIAVSTTGLIRQSGEPHWVSYQQTGVIPPHSYRWVRVLWRSYHCFLQVPGSSEGRNDLTLRVQMGWITRSEDIPLGFDYALSASAATAQQSYCRNRNPTP